MIKNAVLVLAFGLTLMPRPFLAGAAESRIPFRGLKEVAVFVEEIDPEAIKDGLSKEEIKTEVETRLRKAGIKVIPADECLRPPTSPHGTDSYLYIIVNTVKFVSGLEYVYGTSVQLKQVVALERGKTVKPSRALLWATTWEKSEGVEIAWVKDLVGDIRQHINDKVDAFISDCLAANPK
ncbi:MAG: hypothetical protein ABII89_08105 [Candidatus Omnitrophota bacterium]